MSDIAAYQNQSAALNTIKPPKVSRVQSDVERIAAFTRRVNDARSAVLRHTSALGYFSQVGESAENMAKVQPISPNLSAALSELDQSIESLRDALSLFD